MSQSVIEKNLILDSAKVVQKIKRMAFEIYENNFKEKTIALAGIDGQGFVLAGLLAKEIESVSAIKVILLKVKLDKLNPRKQEVNLEGNIKELKSKCVILVDDVLNTGRTLAYSLDPLFEIELKKIEVAVLVNRSHPLYPIMPTYTGLELSTTLSDHVEVVLGKKPAVYLK
jgi:pyrimidine operon attenuation protein / uracil phosphoribosyltransferase